MGLPSWEQYQEMKSQVVDYTSGHLLVTSWRWNESAVEAGQSSGLCVSKNSEDVAEGDAQPYWSCWEWAKDEDGDFDDMAKSYLIDPSTFTETSRLSDYDDITLNSFPAMYGGWLCLPPMDLLGNSYTDCIRFLPSDSYSTVEDYNYGPGQVNMMTYLTSRADTNTTLVEGNDTMYDDGPSVFEFFTVDLMGALSGVSAVGLAVASAVALNF